MIISYLRSSSFGAWEFCQHKYYLNFVLGLDEPSNKASEKGTVVHKVMELLAQINQANKQGKNIIIDDIVGEIEFTAESLLKEQTLNSTEVEFINSTRQNKSIYKEEHQLKLGHTRYGTKLVEQLILPCYQYYSNKSVHKWYPQDFKDCQNWTWMALDWNKGHLDPRRQNIVQAEKRFDITIDEPWAKYKYVVDGGILEGQLAFKGTIDLIIQSPNGGYEVVDYKTGQRKNWAKGYVKEYEHFERDPQLILYYYAVRKLYPEIDNVIMNIYWIRDGGPYSLCFDDDFLVKAELLLRRQFEEIRKNIKPKMCSPKQTDFKCTKLCHFYKNSINGSEHNICKEVHESIKTIGLDKTTAKYSKVGHSVGDYKAPGT